MTDYLHSFRGACALVAAAALAALSACAPEEYALLLDVHARSDVHSISVQVIPRAGSGATARVAQTITRDAATIASDAPIRVAVSFVGPVDVIVNIRGEGPDGATMATRCYSINGVVRDTALLVAIPGSADADGDGFPAQGAVSCLDPEGVAGSHACDHACAGGIGVDCRGCVGSDCPAAPADGDAHIHPGADEICADGVDQDCNGADTACGDLDGDGYDACSAGESGACDCADTDPTRNPIALEVCGDGIDQNCDGADAACDRDGDGFPADRDVGGTPDCDDTDPAVHPDVTGDPTVEICTPDGGTPRDENCNGLIDELSECASNDLDADGAEDCALSAGAAGCDCNDCDPTVGPHAREVCGNGIDENCDGMDTPCAMNDADGDGEISAAAGGTDCNDVPPEGARIGTRAIELCGNGIDENCDGMDTPCSADTDADGYAEPPGCEGNAAIVPYSQELCNGIDDNCDGRVDEPSPLSGAPYDACVLPRAGETGCVDGRCPVQYASSFFHCGGCRQACNFLTTDVCGGGTCQCTNGTGTVAECTGGAACCPAAGCHDLQTDLNFCGNCGNDCTTLYGTRIDSCTGGLCACGSGAVCADGETCCGGSCVNLGNDLTNCGSCGYACTLPFATAACVTAACAIESCAAGRETCDSNVLNGCETDLSLAASCGACGVSCSANATCVAMGSSFGCVCAAGYTGSGVVCTDENECMLGTPCGASSTCTNTPGTYTCACLPGFTSPTSDGHNCANVNECAPANACGRNLSASNTCTDTLGSYTCSCGAGFVASGSGATATCVDVNECTPANACGHNLDPANSCSNSVGSYTCSCAAGFVLSGSGLSATCVNIDECSNLAQCGRTLGGGSVNTCADTVGSYTCTCGAGFTASGSGLTANCVNINECSNVAQCGRSLGGGGVNTCADTSGGYTCTCGAGFIASGSGLTASCANVNECTTPAQCGRTLAGGGVNGCADTSGGYTCSCGAGFTLSGSGLTATCIDVDECAAGGTCGAARASCTNTSGSYICGCDPGYSAPALGGTCTDVNECASGTPCGAGATCTNSPGSYSCVCLPNLLDCDAAVGCETMRSSSNCNSCGDNCNGSTPKCCDVGTYQCSSNSTC